MKSVSKFELIGIFLSVAVMALALAVVRFDTDKVATDEDTSTQAASVIVVDEEEVNQSAALAEAIISVSPGANLSSLVIDDLVEGEGDEVKAGDQVSVHYIGRLQNGQEFDNSYTRGVPFPLEVGAGRVIKGWDEGLVGMKEGGQRILIIPSDLAYGDNGYGPIPGGATLIFAIELVSIN